MDRLIIETVLSDVDEILISGDYSNTQEHPCLLLSYKAANIDQIIHAFAALKKLLSNHEVSLLVCETMVSGMYDLEIVSDAMDEPVRISNKVIEHEDIRKLRGLLSNSPELKIATNVSQEENWIHANKVEIRVC